MINVSCVSFIVFSILDILFLNFIGHIVKKRFVVFPNKLIPILNIILSLIATCIWGVFSEHNYAISIYIQIGIVYGLASVGLHQVVKQTIDYFKIYNYIKKGQKKKSHIVSMSD